MSPNFEYSPKLSFFYFVVFNSSFTFEFTNSKSKKKIQKHYLKYQKKDKIIKNQKKVSHIKGNVF